MNKLPLDVKQPREVKSYVRRSRMTLRQKKGFEELWPVYGLEKTDDFLDFYALYNRKAPVILDIGFGMGASLLHFAKLNPHLDFLGIEVHRPGIGALLSSINEQELSNIKVICADATQVLASAIPDHSLAAALLFFPDPWPKKRHHKRRIVQTSFVAMLYNKLEPGGYFHLATDIPEYAEHARKIMDNQQGFAILSKQAEINASLARPDTKFSRRAVRSGRQLTDLIYVKQGREAE